MGVSLSRWRWLLWPDGLEGDGGLDQADGAQIEAAQWREGRLHGGGNVVEAVLVEANTGQRGPLLDHLGINLGLICHGSVSSVLLPYTPGCWVCQVVAPW